MFVKGKSGNPGGRPKGYAEIKALAQKCAPDAIKTLQEIAKKGKTDAARALAANSLLDRAFGKPAQVVGGDPDGVPIQSAVSHTLDKASAALLDKVIFGKG